MARIGILGAGTWGVALACLLANNGHAVNVWSSSKERAAALQKTHVHPRLPDVAIPSSVLFTGDIAAAAAEKDLLIMVPASTALRATMAAVKPHLAPDQVIAVATKGIEAETLLTMSDVVADELGGLYACARAEGGTGIHLVALSGPTHAEEVSRGLPSAIVAASRNQKAAQLVQDIISCDTMRCYTQTDVLGVELCGAFKNIIALACGIAGGLGYGDNTRAALITRGMEEIKRLGLARGCSERTFDGLAGMGDLVVTATSQHSRNNRAGILIGQGHSAHEAINEVGMVVEGINALPAAIKLAALHEVDMPITRAVDAVVQGKLDARKAVHALMQREGRSETPWKPDTIDNEKYAPLNNQGGQATNTIGSLQKGSHMKRVITYGTYDLLHYGHINLLQRAKEYGDYLIVALSTDEFNWDQKRKKCYFTYEQRKGLLEAVRYVDLVVPENSWDQKRSDMHDFHVDTFVMGDDWEGEFDFLREEGVEVVYLPRTPEISTTQIKQDLNETNLASGADGE